MLHHLPQDPPGRSPDPDDEETPGPLIVPPQSARARAMRARAGRANAAATLRDEIWSDAEQRPESPAVGDADVSSMESSPEQPGLSTRLRQSLAMADMVVVPRLQRGFRAGLERARALSTAVMVAEERVGGGRPLSYGRRNARLLAPAVGLLLLAGTAVHMDRYGDVRRDNAGARQQITEAGDSAGGGSTLAGGEAVEVGPERGEDLDGYIAERQRVLAGLAPDAVHVAVVSFTDTLDASRVEAALGDSRVHSIQFTNPVEPERPLSSSVVDTIATTIENAVASTRSMAQEERRQVQLLIDDGNVGDPAFLEEYERRVVQMDAVLEVLDSDPAIVFAAVIEARADDLRAIADRPDVRLVDPAPPETSVDDSGFWGLLPSDTDTATFGRD